MLTQGIDINMCDQNNQTPLQIAVAINCCEIVEILLREDKIIFANDYENNNELHVWVNKGCEACLKLLKKVLKREKVLGKNIKGNNAVHQAIIQNNFAAFKKLIEVFEYTEYNILGENNNNLLQLCCTFGNLVFYI
jgi:ankyrin repeat protein